MPYRVKLIFQFPKGFLLKQPAMERAESVTLAVKEFAGQRDLFRRYYECDVVGSTEARARWIAPTLRSI
jgi:hypothetical protein